MPPRASETRSDSRFAVESHGPGQPVPNLLPAKITRLPVKSKSLLGAAWKYLSSRQAPLAIGLALIVELR